MLDMLVLAAVTREQAMDKILAINISCYKHVMWTWYSMFDRIVDMVRSLWQAQI